MPLKHGKISMDNNSATRREGRFDIGQVDIYQVDIDQVDIGRYILVLHLITHL